jgi:FkbM family methyltransferase
MVEELVRPGTTVWDVGANVGLFSFCAAGLSGPSGFVLSVEPDLWLAQLLGRSSQELSRSQSTCSCVQVLCASISDSNRVTELSVSERARSSNHLVHASGSSQAQGSRYNQLTVSLTLDSLLEHFPPPSVLKIDVETHEANVSARSNTLVKRSTTHRLVRGISGELGRSHQLAARGRLPTLWGCNPTSHANRAGVV